MDGLTIYRRNLPHWRLHRAVYFVTWRLHEHQRELEARERTVIVDALKYFDRSRYELYAYVVMNDHVHALVQPHDAWTLQQIVHSWKSFTTNRLQREFHRVGVIWLDEYFDRIMRDENEFFEKMNYILTNPFRRWPDLKEYPWCGAVNR